MKKIVMLLLLVSSVAFSQAQKDSLLLADKEAILDKLSLMLYLDRVGMEFWTMPDDKYRKESDKTFPYYFETTIVKNNPSTIDLKKYMGDNSKDFKPINWKDYLHTAYEKNIAEFVAMTEKYGYISAERINMPNDNRVLGQVTFVVRTNSHDAVIKKLLKKEKKIGNLSEGEYEHFKFFLERKGILTNEDIKRLEKNGVKSIFKTTP